MRRAFVAALVRSSPALALCASAACATAARPPAGAAPAAAPDSAPVPLAFPPVPRVTGKFDLRVVYPPDGATIVARDSTFIFGSLGTGDAQLTVNGVNVPVLPNGAWLGWLPLPPRDNPRWSLVAARGSDTVRVTRRLVLPPARPMLSESGPLAVDSASLRPGTREARLATDFVRVALRAPRSATVDWIAADGTRRALRPPANPAADSSLWATDIEARLLATPGRLVVARGADTVSLVTPRVALVDSMGPRYAVLGDRPVTLTATAPDSDRVIIGRPVASGGTYKWFFLPGTVVEVTGRSGDMVRARVDRDLSVWFDGADVRELPTGTAAPVRVAGNARVVSRGAEWSDLVIPMAERPPVAVTETADALVLELYGTTANTDILNFDSRDAIVRRVTWEQVGEGRARYVVSLHAAPFGYLVRWERGALVLRIRRAPVVNAGRPLQGLTIAVDAGHPPGGSTGPTGLYEAVATLAISQRLKTMLEARGANVFMTRTAPGALGLADRPELARRAGAHAFVSIHLNALPDGVNPFTAHGTGTYFFTPRSEPLARAVQRGMVRRMGLRDLGTNYDNLAVLRPTWMPAILCEGAFVMMPDQEALLRTAEFQEAYALGVVEGVESYFRGLVGR